MAGTMVVRQYTDDLGTNWRLFGDKNNLEAGGLTTPGVDTDPEFPPGWAPRRARFCYVSTGSSQGTGQSCRTIPMDAAAWAALAPGATVSLPDYQAPPGVGQTTPNVMRAFVFAGKFAERLDKRRRHRSAETGETLG